MKYNYKSQKKESESKVKKLEDIKDKIKVSKEYFSRNVSEFNYCKRMAFDSSIDQDELQRLMQIGKPPIEANILSAYLSRIIGEVTKNIPDIVVEPCAGEIVPAEIVSIIEGHIRYVIDEANKNGMEEECYKDTLAGGFSSAKVWIDYENEMSFKKKIYAGKTYSPVLCGFDPMAVKPSKEDAQYCWEIVPKLKKELQEEYPNEDFSSFKSSFDIGGMQWSYTDKSDKDIVLVADFYEKQHKRKRIVYTATGQVMTSSQYAAAEKEWDESGAIEQFPVITHSRWTNVCEIKRYVIIGDRILKEENTYYKKMPIIFIDGNSTYIQKNDISSACQLTVPYIKNAIGVQKLQNALMQTIAQSAQNLSQNPWVIPKGSVPPGLEEAWRDPQIPRVLQYNAYKDNDTSVPLPPPQRVQHVPLPPEIIQTFQYMPALVQNVLGSFDSSFAKLTDQQVSGVAIQEASTLSNASAMPYVTNFLRCFQSIAESILQLIPMVYTLPGAIPVLDKTGDSFFVSINQDKKTKLYYDPSKLRVKVNASTSFGVQKSKALQQITALSSSNPFFAELFGKDAPDIVVDNIDCRGQDMIKERTIEKMKKMKESEQMASEMAAKNGPPGPPPEVIMAQAQNTLAQAEVITAKSKEQQIIMDNQIEVQKLAQEKAKIETDAIIRMQQLQLDKQKNEVESMKAMADIIKAEDDSEVKKEKAKADIISKSAEIAIKARLAENKILSDNLKESSIKIEKITEENESSIDE